MKQAQRLTSVTAYGWRVVKMRLAAGKSYGYLVQGAKPRSAMHALGLWVQGCIESRNVQTGATNTLRQPGAFSGEFPAIAAGRYVLTALQDTDWWCIDQKVNGGVLPQVEPLRLTQGQQVSGLLLILSGPDEGTITSSYTAPAPCYAFRFQEARP